MWRILHAPLQRRCSRSVGGSTTSATSPSSAASSLVTSSLRSFCTHTSRLLLAVPPAPSAASLGSVPAPSIEEVWDLWNEGNLYRLSQAQLQAFLTAHGVTVDAAWKKTALVKQVEGIVKADNPTVEAAVKKRAQEQVEARTRKGAGAAESGDTSTVTPFVYDELRSELVADMGDSAEPLFGVATDPSTGDGAATAADGSFVDIQQAGLYSAADGVRGLASFVPRAFQVIHEDASPDVLVSRMNTTAFPSGNATYSAYTFVPANASTANRTRFQKAFHWCVVNLWNMNLDGELHISFGKMLLWHQGERPSPSELMGGSSSSSAVAANPRHDSSSPLFINPIATRHISKRNNMTLWSAQQLMQGPELPYSWLNMVHEESEADLQAYVTRGGYEACPIASGEGGDGTSAASAYHPRLYRCHIKRQTDVLEADVLLRPEDGTYETIALQPAWERFLATYYLRSAMPDARLQLRARPPTRSQKALSMFDGIPLLRAPRTKKGAESSSSTTDALVRSAVPAELGEITYAVLKETKSWMRPTSAPTANVRLSSNTTRVVLMKDRNGVVDDKVRAPRWDVELICPIPPQHTRLDINTLSEELWAEMLGVVGSLERSTRAFRCLPVAASTE